MAHMPRGMRYTLSCDRTHILHIERIINQCGTPRKETYKTTKIK